MSNYRPRILQISRYQDWWSCKMSPLLAIGYGTAVLSGAEIYKTIPWLLFFLVAMVIGAIYASAINEISDVKDDLASGKTNHARNLSASLRWLIPVSFLLLGAALFFKMATYSFWALLYPASCIAFSMYSLKPIRLKERGVWGAFADASGAHFFPSLLMVAGTSIYCGVSINWMWFAAVGIWSACFGLRGILWHQFQDRKNDEKIGLKTLATQSTPEKFRKISIIISSIEVASFLLMMTMLRIYLSIPYIIIYLMLLYLRERKMGVKTGLIAIQGSSADQIFMLEYYIVFFPLSILLSNVSQPYVLIMLAIHLMMFPARSFHLIRHFYWFTFG